LSRLIHLAGSAAALSALLALLMADSAAEPCSVVPFDRTFVVTSSCPEYGSETIRVRLNEGPVDNRWVADVEHVDGDQVVITAELGGGCSEEGDPVQYGTLDLTLTQSDGSGLELGCAVYLDGQSEPFCFEPSGTDCTLTVEEVEERR
jgi:hypothetical protein